MKKSTILKIAVVVLAIALVVVSAVFVKTDVADASSNYYATIVSLLPPILAIVLALITKEVYLSVLFLQACSLQTLIW